LVNTHNSEHEELENKIYSGLISQLIKFYRHSLAPASLNIYILQLLNKLIQDYRSLIFSVKGKEVDESAEIPNEELVSNHFSRIHVDKNFIQELISEADILKNNQSEITGAQTLFSKYLQIQIELVVGTLLPTCKGEKIKSVVDLIEMPKWLSSIAEAAQILAFLESPKNMISENVENMCFEQTKISNQWERVVIVSKLPIDLTRKEIEEKVVGIVKKHRGILRDIYIPEGDINSPKSEIRQELKALFEQK
jgi:hypothetical protein